MFGILGVISIICVLYMIIKESLEKPAPKDVYFDWDEYYKDIENGINPMEQVRKRERGEYMKSKSDPNWKYHK